MEKSKVTLKKKKVTWNVPESFSKKPKITSLIFCTQANRPKLQFKTEIEAERYMEWNSDEILRESGKAPVRAYWCNRCMCYHITSRAQQLCGKRRKQEIIEVLQNVILTEDCQKSREYLQQAEKLLDESIGGSKSELLSLFKAAKRVVRKREINQG